MMASENDDDLKPWWDSSVLPRMIADLDIEIHDPGDKELGGLISSFNRTFGTSSLLPLYFCANDSHGKIRFAVTSSLTAHQPSAEYNALADKDKLHQAREHLMLHLRVGHEFRQMKRFVAGYVAAIEVRRKGVKRYRR